MIQFKITMLGASNSGKSTFMLALYDEMNKGRESFSLTATEKSLHNKLVNRWDKIQYNKEWTWSDIAIDKYTFSFEKGDTKLINFDYVDYGGSLLANDTEDSEYNTLSNHLISSQIIMCCVLV